MGYNILALSIGMLAPCCMSTKHVIIRMYKGNYDPMSQAIDGVLIESVIYSVIACFLIQDPNFNFTFQIFLTGTLGSCLRGTAVVLIAIAVGVGLAGPAQSLMSTHGMH
jgi:hypothetical protein